MSERGRVLIVLLFFLTDTPIGGDIELSGLLAAVVKVILWPVSVCLHLVGPGPNIGTAEKPLHEWTPVEDFAVVVGIDLSWALYSSIAFLSIQFHRALHRAGLPDILLLVLARVPNTHGTRAT